MKRVTRNDDISFNIDDVRGKAERYNITFYTTNPTVNVKKSDRDVKDGIIVLNGAELINIGAGVLNFRVDNLAENSDYDDGIYNTSFTRTTNYYIVSNVVVPDGTDTESVIDVVSDMVDRINTEIQRSTGKDSTHDLDISDIKSRLGGINDELEQLQQTVSSNYNDIYTKWLNDHYPLLTVISKVADIENNVNENEDVIAAAFNELRQIIRENEETIAAALNNISNNNN